jgi:hypothetical protein
MEAHIKRDMEQQDLLERMEKLLLEDGMGSFLPDPMILQHAICLLNHVVVQMVENELLSPLDQEVSMVIGKIKEFARTPEEGLILKQRLLEKLVEQGFTIPRQIYLNQRVFEEERLYDGHKAMDEVDP